MTLDEFNALNEEQRCEQLQQCCAAPDWIRRLAAAPPFAGMAGLLAESDAIWRDIDEANLLEAFSAHPQIGNVETLREKYAATKALASGEQSAVNEADEHILQDLAEKNAAYLEKFGFIFIVCATGKTAEQMLSLLVERLPNRREEELLIAAEEQRKITNIRLHKLLNSRGQP